MKQNQTVLPYLSGLAYATIFGCSFLVTKNVLAFVDPFHFLGLRFLFAVSLMSLLILLKIVKVNYRNKNIKSVVILGLFQPLLYFTCETLGVQRVSSSQVGMMIALIPIFVAIFSVIFLKEYLTKLQMVCIALSVSGVLFIVSMQGNGGGTTNYLGYVFLFGAVLSAATFNVSSRKLSKQFSPLELTYIMMWVGTVSFNILGYIQYRQLGKYSSYFAPLFNVDVIPAFIYLAFLSSIVAFALVNFTLSQLPAARASLFANLVTVISIIAGVVFRNESFMWYHFVGCCMILGGVWGVNHFTKKVIKKDQQVVA